MYVTVLVNLLLLEAGVFAIPWRSPLQLWQPSQQTVLGSIAKSVKSQGEYTQETDGSIRFPHKPLLPPAGFVALGDSYSAGIGTGFNGTEHECRLGLHAYPMLIRNDILASQKHAYPTFQHLSCTGSTIADVLSGGDHSQIDGFNTTASADFALLSIGGNDLGFFDIMNSCIFRFYSFYSGTCEAALERSQQQIADPEFDQHLRLLIMEILDRVQWEKRPWFTVTVTGYARFFNQDTPECDDYSLGMWWRGPKLERKLRRRMNKMVRDVNGRIRQAIDTINAGFMAPRVIYVDYDDAFEGHRFCEPGVKEPDYTRNETWFFHVGALDNDGSSNPQPEPPLPPDSPLIDPDQCMAMAEKSGDWGQKALCMMAVAMRDDPSLVTAGGPVAVQNSMWYVPTYYGKTFHPVSLYISDEV
jgi:SAGA-associated factor 73